MNFARAVAFLWVASLRNRGRQQLQRLRKPRYLVGLVVGLAYVYSLFWRRLYLVGGEGPSEGAPLLVRVGLAGTLLATVLSAWALGTDRPSLSFSAVEVQQLLPAPVTRQALLRYKLLRGFMGSAVGALFATLFVGRAAGSPPVLFFLGALLALALVHLHVTGASLVRTRLAEWGWRGTALRWGVLLAVLGGVGLVLAPVLLRHPPPLELARPRALLQWLDTLGEVPALVWLSWPVRAVVGLPLAPDGASFLRRLPVALGLLGAHYAWVMSMRVPFEESALLRGEARERQRSQRLAAREGGGRAVSLRGAAWRLRATGRPEVALLWKNLIAGRRLGGQDALLLLVVGAAVVLGVLAVVSPARFALARAVVAPMCLMFALLLPLFGPSTFRTDLRMDLRKLDMLRAMPLTGWQVVGAELLAPALVLAVLELLLLAVGLGLGLGLTSGGSGEAEAGVALGLTAALVLPAVTLGGLLVQNAAVVLFPAWLPPEGERARGFEALGQRLLTLLGTLLVLGLGLVPAAVAAALVGFGLEGTLGLGVWALPFSGLTAALVLVAEVALGVLALGHAFDRLDVSGEGPLAG